MDSKYEGDPREGERSYFSDRTDTPDDDRTILSNALKAAVKNEIEWANLAEYQSQITKMNEQQEKLRELKEQIRAKMFVPGGEATTEIDTLEGRIKKAKADLKASMDNEERKSIRADILELTNQLNDAKVERAKQRESEKEELKKLREQANKVANRINIYDKKLLKLEATTPLRRVVERERQKAIDLDKKKNKEFFDNYKQNVKNTQTRQRIRRLIDEINSRNFNPKVNKYVPESLVKATNEILGMINLDSQRKGERAESFRAKLAELKIKYDELKNDPKYADTVYNKTISDMIQNLAENVGDTDVYHMTSQQLQLTFNTLTALMHEIKEGVKLHNFGNAIDANTTTVQAAKMMSKELDDNKIGSDSLAAKWLQMQLRPETMFERLAGFKKDSTWMKAYRMLERGQIRQFDFERRANELFKDVMSAKDVKNGSKLYVDTLSDPKNLYDIGLRDSKNEPVKITKGMALSIYMHLQNQDNARHFANGGITVPDIKKYYKSSGDAWGTGTVVLHGISTDERLIELREEYKKLLDEKKEAKKNGDLEKEFEIENQLDVLASELHVYNEMAKDFCGKIQKNILSILDQNDKRFLRLTREYFDGLSKQELNKATMELYGFGKASVDKYFPIHTDAAFRTASFESISKDFNLENSGFMKDRIVASNPILLEDIAEVINTSIKNTARYVGLTLAIKDFSKLYGTSEKGYAGSVQESLRKKFGDPGKKYIENLLSDLVGSRNQPSTFLDRARGNMAAATLTLNVRVALGQTASFPTAAAVLGYGPIAKALSMGFKPADRALIAKWSPLLYKRTESGSSEELAGIRERAQLQNKIARSTKFLTGWIEAMDAATVGRLWYASQFYVDDNYKGLVKGSDNYYMAVAEVFNKVVEQTQPNYTVLQRPDILRNPNALVKQLTMFMTQRLQNFNILYDSVGRLRKYNADLKAGVNGVTADDVKKAKVGVANAVTSQLLATGFLVGFKLAADVITHNMNAYRDEDKELTWLSVLLKLLEDGIASLISITVGGSEIYEYGKTLITGDRYYGVSVGGLGAIEDVATSFKSITDELHKEDGQVTVSHFNKLAKSVGVFAGVPVANAEKLAMAGYHYYNDFVNDELGTFESGNNRTAKEDERRMYDAIVNGNSRVLDQYKKKYPGDKWKNEVRKLLKSQDPRIKSAAAAKNGGDYDKFYSLVKEIKAEKHFSQDEIISAVNSFITEMNKDKDSSDSEGKHKALFNKTDMENAVAAGNYDILDEMTDEIINTKMDNGDTEAKATKDTMSSLKSAIRTSVKEGKISTDQGVKLLVEFLDMSKEDAEKSLQSQAKSDIVEDYNDGLLSDSEAVSKLQSEVGLSADDAKSRVRYLTFKKNYPQYNVEESTLNRYYSDWESTGIGVESFMDFYTGTKDIKGYDKDGDGKNDAYTRIDQVIAFIAKMPISSEQKTKLLSYYWPKKYTEYRKRAPW